MKRRDTPHQTCGIGGNIHHGETGESQHLPVSFCLGGVKIWRITKPIFKSSHSQGLFVAQESSVKISLLEDGLEIFLLTPFTSFLTVLIG
ncbi:Hypothetical predicted protein [Octopus vulgaris]|uniref:Uncharacterized protein n=1 Tax=Octopus vulgaris TaxID=6645 RepID=A0AA36F5D5_OCTVU|nr:Hypothetical predicted protein [Octopus vulgaris]